MSAFQNIQEMLEKAGIEVQPHNNGQHFICFKNGAFVDFWPKKELFIDRVNKNKQYGAKQLIAFFDGLTAKMPEQEKPLNSEGMTLRDYFAAKAMQGLVVDAVIDVDAIASMSYRIANAMMKERAVNHG